MLFIHNLGSILKREIMKEIKMIKGIMDMKNKSRCIHNQYYKKQKVVKCSSFNKVMRCSTPLNSLEKLREQQISLVNRDLLPLLKENHLLKMHLQPITIPKA
jgi:hypothetical protein